MPDIGLQYPVTNIGTSPRTLAAPTKPLIQQAQRSDTAGSTRKEDRASDGPQLAQRSSSQTKSGSSRDLSDLSPAQLGPPPTFEANLLEFEARLSNLLKRLVAAQELEKNVSHDDPPYQSGIKNGLIGPAFGPHSSTPNGAPNTDDASIPKDESNLQTRPDSLFHPASDPYSRM